MRSLKPTHPIVVGTSARRVARIRLPAGSWDIDCELGVPTAESTATMIVRPIGGATALTFTSALAPARLASQRLTIGSATEVEFVVSNSSQNRGQAVVDDIRIAAAPLQQWANGIRLTLAANISSGATSFDVVGGSALPSLTGDQFFMATLQEGTSFEVIRVTARSGNTLTVTRGAEGSDPQAFTSANAVLLVANTAETMERIQGLL